MCDPPHPPEAIVKAAKEIAAGPLVLAIQTAGPYCPKALAKPIPFTRYHHPPDAGS